jgi:hypothetical protein
MITTELDEEIVSLLVFEVLELCGSNFYSIIALWLRCRQKLAVPFLMAVLL